MNQSLKAHVIGYLGFKTIAYGKKTLELSIINGEENLKVVWWPLL